MKSVKDFFEYDVITKIEIKRENEMILPAVTLCVNRTCYDENCLDKEIYILDCRYNLNANCSNNFQNYNYIDKTCVTINNLKEDSTDYLKSSKGGKKFGLQMAVYLPKSYYVTVLISDNQVKAGFNQLENLYTAVLTEANYKIRKLVDKKLPSPYNKCVITSDSPLYKEIVDSNITYTQEYCFTYCICKYFTKTCNCSFFPIYGNTQSNESCLINECFKKEFFKFNDIQECGNLCPFECESTSFEISAQSFQYNYPYIPETFSEIIKMPLNLSNFTQEKQKNILNKSFIVRVYYESLKYTETSQVPKTTFPDIVSIVGGTMGLFLGVSLLSSIEVLGFLIECFLISIKKGKSNRQVNNLSSGIN